MLSDMLFNLADWSAKDVATIEIGNHGHKVYVIDNFFANPEFLRKYALTLPYRNHHSEDYPGIRVSVDFNEINFYQDLNLKVKDIIFDGNELKGIAKLSIITWRGEDLPYYMAQNPHHDKVNCIVATIYLNPARQCKGGTGFYRHRKTQYESILEVGEKFDKTSHYEEIYRNPENKFDNGYINESNETWELIHKVDMVFNRAVFYPAHLFHSPYFDDNWFGKALNEKRLTLNLMLMKESQPYQINKIE